MELPKRKNTRLKEYDYSKNGAYFITVCINNRNVLLWNNVGADIIRPNETPPLSEYGMIVGEAINNIQKYYSHVTIDKYCIMPDHIHMIIFILSDDDGRIISAPTLSTIIGQMKRYVSKQIGFPIWQKSFNDRIIRNEKGYKEVWQYIDDNPIKWELDEYYSE